MKNPNNLTQIQKYFPFIATWKLRNASFVLLLLAVSNILTNSFFNPSVWNNLKNGNNSNLYLIEKASIYITDISGFEKKVKQIAQELEVPPEWIMAVIYSESRFNAAAINLKGSGAVGLIQFMPATSLEMNITNKELSEMTPIQQLDYVKLYLEKVKRKYGKYDSLTKLYLAILFPKALEGDNCFMLYAKPSVAYKQNSGLDENKDGIVTTSDIDKRMQRIFPSAYMKQLVHNEKFNINNF